MRKDDRLRRSELFLPPPSINKHRVIPDTDEKLEEKQITGFLLGVAIAGVLGFILASAVYGSILWVVIQLLERDVPLVNCIAVTGIAGFVRALDRTSRKRPD
jgi:tetrahydromethanopterin S-methyltransferase subunit F